MEKRGALALLRRADFRRLYLAVAVSELGDAFHYIAIMWFALIKGGPLGVVAVRLADSVPALVFGFHGGIVADRLSRKRTMIAADLVRGAILVPVALAGLTGTLPLWGLVLAAFVLETATSYFVPAYSAMVPALVARENVQEANGLIAATTNALSIGGWAAAAGLLAVAPISTFFALNAASFFLSALFISGIAPREVASIDGAAPPRIREAFDAMRPLPAIAIGTIVIGLAVTVSSGTWIAGVPDLVRNVLHRGAGGFSIVMVGYAIGSVAAGALLTRFPIANKARASMFAWILYLPAFMMFALASSLRLAVAAAFLSGLGQVMAATLLRSAAQEQVRDDVLGRVMGVIELVYRGAHATGLMLVAPLFVIVAPRAMFAASAIAIPLFGVIGALVTIYVDLTPNPPFRETEPGMMSD
ncbi:MAG TPA: MFS transporter [Candidatus Binataceae bacterium]|nr:MFS transporter [Candidatus Binataceae bacterium]